MATSTKYIEAPDEKHLLPRSHQWQRWISLITLILVSCIGIVAFFMPFLSKTTATWSTQQSNMIRLVDSPLLIAALVVSCLLVLFANIGPGLSSKSVALLGVLVGINAVLRLLDQTFIPLGEVSPIFLLIILVGYCFGAEQGFLMGTLSLLGSALITGGIGPWLPFQMFAAGWMGMTAAWLPTLLRVSTIGSRPRRELIGLILFGAVWALLYGALLNLYFWPFLTGSADTTWVYGISLSETLTHYLTFYLLQSLPSDLVRVATNVILILSLGMPLLQVFNRFRSRFTYQTVSDLTA